MEEDALLHSDVLDGERCHGFFTDSYNKK